MVPTIVASTPKCASVWTSTWAVRALDVGGVATRRRARLQQRPVGQAILGAALRRVEGQRGVVRRLVGRVGPGLGRKQRRRLGRERPGRDDVGVRLDPVDRDGRRPERPRRRVDPLVRPVGLAPVGPLDALERPARRAPGLAHGVAGAAEQSAGGGAGDEQEPGEHERDADDEGARLAEDLREAAPECRADGASVGVAERDHQPHDADERGPCGTGGGRRASSGRASARRCRGARQARRASPSRARHRATLRRARRWVHRPSRARARSRGRARTRRARAPRARDAGDRGSSAPSCGRAPGCAACASAPAQPASSSWPWA